VGNGTGSNCRRRRRGPGSANNAAAPINRTKRIHSERPPHSPEGDSPKVYGRQFRCSGCHRLIRPNALALLDSFYLCKWSPRRDSNPRPTDYESDDRRRPGWFQYGSSLLTLDAASVQTAREASRLIVGMIKAHPTEIGCQGKPYSFRRLPVPAQPDVLSGAGEWIATGIDLMPGQAPSAVEELLASRAAAVQLAVG
jgi:hypothetical protein